MSVYCTATINSTDYYVSTDMLSETVFWDSLVVDIGQITIAMDSDYGGQLNTSYGTIEFLPPLFDGNWPPPQRISVLIETGEDDQNKTLLCESAYVLKSFDQVSVKYDVIGLGSDVTDDAETFSDFLDDVFTWGAGLLSYDVDTTTYTSRASALAVSYTLDTETLVTDVLKEAAKFFCHYFYIDETQVTPKIYLVDLLSSTGTTSMDEFDFLPNSYQGGAAISLLKADDSAETSLPGNTSEGKEISIKAWDTNATNITAALTNILAILEQPLVTVSIADADTAIEFGTAVTLTDESLLEDYSTSFWVLKKNINYSASAEKLILEGREVIV